MDRRRFALDTALSVAVFVPLTAVWNVVLNKVTLEALAVICIGALAVNILAGGFYGKLLDAWRKKWNY